MITILASDAYAWICVVAVFFFFFCLGIIASRNNIVKKLTEAGKEANLKGEAVTVSIRGRKGQKVNLNVQPGGDI